MKRLILLLCLLFSFTIMIAGCGADGEEAKKETAPENADASISATTTVVKKPTANTAANGSSTKPIMSEENAKWYALFCAGTTEDRISDYTCQLIYHEERKCQAYEITFHVGRTRFEYIFRATDLDIIKNEKIIGEE